MEKVIKKTNSVVTSKSAKTLLKVEKVFKQNNVKVVCDPVKYNQVSCSTDDKPPIINLKKKGDVLESIEIICPCGKKTEVLCQYD